MVIKLPLWLGPLRRRIGYCKHAVSSTAFRFIVDQLRWLGILPQAAQQQDPSSILIVNLTPHLGDAIMMMPLIEALRAALPKARLECAVENSTASLLRQLPQLDTVYGLTLGKQPPITRRLASAWALRVVHEYWRVMRSARPTVCILSRWGDDLFRSNALAYLTGAPVRVGFSWRVRFGNAPAPYRDAFLTKAVRGGNGLHEPVRFPLLAVEAGLLPASVLEGLSVKPVSALQQLAATEDWKQLEEALNLEKAGPFAVVAPGASHPKKMWPLAKWTHIVAALQKLGLQVVLLSGPSDANCARELHEMCDRSTVLVAGSTTLLESAALCAHATVFVGNDSGPAHMAGALGVPTVVLFTTPPSADPDDPYSPARNRPLGPYVVVCQPAAAVFPCTLTCVASRSHCIAEISPADVLEAIHSARRLQESQQNGSMVMP